MSSTTTASSSSPPFVANPHREVGAVGQKRPAPDHHDADIVMTTTNGSSSNDNFASLLRGSCHVRFIEDMNRRFSRHCLNVTRVLASISANPPGKGPATAPPITWPGVDEVVWAIELGKLRQSNPSDIARDLRRYRETIAVLDVARDFAIRAYAFNFAPQLAEVAELSRTPLPPRVAEALAMAGLGGGSTTATSSLAAAASPPPPPPSVQARRIALTQEACYVFACKMLAQVVPRMSQMASMAPDPPNATTKAVLKELEIRLAMATPVSLALEPWRHPLLPPSFACASSSSSSFSSSPCLAQPVVVVVPRTPHPPTVAAETNLLCYETMEMITPPTVYATASSSSSTTVMAAKEDWSGDGSTTTTMRHCRQLGSLSMPLVTPTSSSSSSSCSSSMSSLLQLSSSSSSSLHPSSSSTTTIVPGGMPPLRRSRRVAHASHG